MTPYRQARIISTLISQGGSTRALKALLRTEEFIAHPRNFHHSRPLRALSITPKRYVHIAIIAAWSPSICVDLLYCSRIRQTVDENNVTLESPFLSVSSADAHNLERILMRIALGHLRRRAFTKTQQTHLMVCLIIGRFTKTERMVAYNALLEWAKTGTLCADSLVRGLSARVQNKSVALFTPHMAKCLLQQSNARLTVKHLKYLCSPRESLSHEHNNSRLDLVPVLIKFTHLPPHHTRITQLLTQLGFSYHEILGHSPLRHKNKK